MHEWFMWLLLGHFVGDYLLQNRWMAFNKKKNVLACLTHCFVYTLSVMVFLSFSCTSLPWFVPFLIFFSHWVLDGTHILEKWMTFYGVRTWDSGLPRKQGEIDFESVVKVKEAVQVSFGALVHAVADNTVHVILMVLSLKLTGVV